MVGDQTTGRRGLIRNGARLLAAALFALCAAAPAQAQNDTAELEAELQLEAARTPRTDLGGGFVLLGAEAEGTTLRFRVQITGQATAAIDSAAAAQLPALCADPAFVETIERGATLVFVYEIPEQGREITVSASKESCAAAGTAPPPPDVPELAAMIQQDGLEATLSALVASTGPLEVMNGLVMDFAAAEGSTLTVLVSISGVLASDAENLGASVQAMICSLPETRTFLRAGATIEMTIQVAGLAEDQVVVVTEGACL